jgi:hypothetical protein
MLKVLTEKSLPLTFADILEMMLSSNLVMRKTQIRDN